MDKPVAVVTGGSRGIGRAIVEDLAATHTVFFTYNANRAAADLVAASTGATMLPCQLSSLESIYSLCSELEARTDRIDLLVNNAGMAPRVRQDLLEASVESFDELVATNLRGPYFLTQQIARRMLACKAGRIVFIGSISAFTASTSRGDYCLSKAGISMAAQLFAARLAPHGIPVFEVQPGIIRTEMIASVAETYEKRVADGLLPQRRMGEPRDVALAIRAIADGKLDYCTGQIIHVDGGFHLRTL